MKMFLSILGWGLLGLLALVLLLLLLPVSLLVEIKQDGITVRLKILAFSFWLYPRRSKRGSKDSKQEDQPTKVHSDDAEPQPVLSEEKDGSQTLKKLGLSDLTQLVSTTGWLMRIVLKLIHIRDIRIVYPIQGEDAAQTAIRYGKFHAYLGSTLGVLQNFLKLHFKQVDILPDFNNNCKYRRYFYCKIQAIPFIIVIVSLYALARLKGEKVV